MGTDRGAQSFPPDRRLRQRTEFDKVFRRSRRSADGLFTVLARPTSESSARLGMAISVKATGGAVVRNRVKRVVRESFRSCLPNLPCVDIVVLCRPAVRERSKASLRKSLDTHWKRIIERCGKS